MHLVAIGGSDAGISAALRARELDPATDVTVVVADSYPNFSICGIPYYISGEVTHWSNLAHRTYADLTATGMKLRLDTVATAIEATGQRVRLRDRTGTTSTLDYDALVVGTGAEPVRPPIAGLAELGPADGVHLLHSMGDTFALTDSLERIEPTTALIVGAGYIGLEMAEGLTARGIRVTQVEMAPEVLPTVDPELGALVHAELERHGVEVRTGCRVTRFAKSATGIVVTAAGPDGDPLSWTVDLVLVVVGVTPASDLLVRAGAGTGPRGAVLVDDTMATGLPHIWAAGDCVVTHHRLLGTTYLPLGTTAHKQGRIAGENAIGGAARYAGSLGTQVVKVFDLVAARTGLREREATAAGYHPVSTTATPDDHKAYYPGASPITIRVTGDRESGRLLGAQLIGARGTETAKRVDTCATALFHDMSVAAVSELDLSYTPPAGLTLGRRSGGDPGLDQPTRPAQSPHPTQPRSPLMSPSVLFVCVKNGGKSQMAAALMRQIAGDRITVHSAGTRPGKALNTESAAAVAEIGASMAGEFPKPIDPALLDSVDRVVIIGSDAQIENPGRAPIERWETDEPSTRGIEGAERMRLIREDIRRRVTALADELG